jgi:putative FmdB family regulatory protein
MPTYEYACKKCGHEFEVLQSMSAPALKTCPEDLCGRKKWGHGAVTKKISAGAGLLFKGSGFYITDYRSEGYKKSAKTEAAPTKTDAGATKTAPAKPAVKTEKK